MSQADRAVKNALSDLGSVRADEIRTELMRSLGEHLDALQCRFELRLPAGTDPDELQKIVDAINKLGAHAMGILEENLVLKAKLMMKDA